jgi:sodium/bile acid cotransporter 3/5
MLMIKDPLMGFGLLVIGVCPGGIASNFWTLLLDGDVNLSITMTFVSSIAAMGQY